MRTLELSKPKDEFLGTKHFPSGIRAKGLKSMKLPKHHAPKLTNPRSTQVVAEKKVKIPQNTKLFVRDIRAS